MNKDFNKYSIISKENIDENIFNIFCKKINEDFSKIDDFFKIDFNHIIVELMSKENLDKKVKEESIQYKNIPVPEWLVGFSTSKSLYVIIPCDDNLNEIIKVALHEITHLISYNLEMTKQRPKILDEGIAVYLSNQYEGKIYTPWVNAYLNKSLPKVSDLCTYSSIEFAEKNGYKLSYLVIEFLINNYGKDTFISWLKNPDTFLEKINEIDSLFQEYIIQKIETRIK